MEGEDAYYTRRQDVLTPTCDDVNEILDVLLPLHGIRNSGEVRRLVKVFATVSALIQPAIYPTADK